MAWQKQVGVWVTGEPAGRRVAGVALLGRVVALTGCGASSRPRLGDGGPASTCPTSCDDGDADGTPDAAGTSATGDASVSPVTTFTTSGISFTFSVDDWGSWITRYCGSTTGGDMKATLSFDHPWQ